MEEAPAKPLTAFQQFQLDYAHLIPAQTSAGERSRQFQRLWSEIDELTRRKYEESAKTAAKLYRHRAALYLLEHPGSIMQKAAEKQRRRVPEDASQESLYALVASVVCGQEGEMSRDEAMLLLEGVRSKRFSEDDRVALKKWAAGITAAQEQPVRAARRQYQALK